MKQIVFSISKGTWVVNIKTKSLLADKEDRECSCKHENLYRAMYNLTVKYNERNIAVLFEID